jgi:beta-N-acetylglucosaminidase
MVLCNAAYGFSHDFDVRTKSDITAEQLDAKFESKDGSKLKGTGKYFIEAQEKYGINAEFLAAIAMHESANGTSSLARRKNNFFGLRGKKGWSSFESPEECIMFAANNLAKPGGYYFGRGHYTIGSIGKRYASDKKWSKRIVATMQSIR